MKVIKENNTIKCVKETTRKYYKYVEDTWEQVFLTSTGGVGGSVCACEGSSAYSATSYAVYFAFAESPPRGWMANGNSGWVTYYSPDGLKLGDIEAQFYDSSFPSGHYSSSLTIQGSNDNSNWTTLKTYTPTRSGRETVSINSQDSYKYNRFSVSGSYPWIQQMKINNTTYIHVVESTESDYDFYEDIDSYKVVRF